MSTKPNTITLFDIAISNVAFDEVCERITEQIASEEPGFIVTPNVDHVCTCHRNPGFREAYGRAFLTLPDGAPIIWASYLLGVPLNSKLSGSDMVPRLCAYAAKAGHSVFFLGGTPGTAAKTAEVLTRNNPGLTVAGVHCPDYGFEKRPDELQQTLGAVRDAKPDICFIALGSPKQELIMERHYREMGVPVCMGVGATFDFVAGRILRAPRWIQRAGFEWLWRLAQEPRRLWRRYLWEDLVFFRLLWRELFRRKARRAEAAAQQPPPEVKP